MDDLHKPGRIPEGAVIATILGVGTRQCTPLDGTPCDSWKVFGLATIRIVNGNPIQVAFALCRKHLQAYIDDVLFNNNISWGNATEELGIEMEDDDDD